MINNNSLEKLIAILSAARIRMQLEEVMPRLMQFMKDNNLQIAHDLPDHVQYIERQPIDDTVLEEGEYRSKQGQKICNCRLFTEVGPEGIKIGYHVW